MFHIVFTANDVITFTIMFICVIMIIGTLAYATVMDIIHRVFNRKGAK